MHKNLYQSTQFSHFLETLAALKVGQDKFWKIFGTKMTLSCIWTSS